MSDAAVLRRLRELAQRTAALAPDAGYQARIMAAIALDAAAAFRSEVVRSARRFMPVALLVAIVTLGIATQIDGASSAAIAVAEDSEELAW